MALLAIAGLVGGACSAKKSSTTGVAARATSTTESTAPATTGTLGAPDGGGTTTVAKATTTSVSVARSSTTTAAGAGPRPTTTLAVSTTTASAHTETVHATGPPDYGFSPATFSVAAGSKVVVANDSQVAPHTWTADDGSFDSGSIAAGASSAPITLTKRGTFPFYCKIHGAALMHGTITVT